MEFEDRFRRVVNILQDKEVIIKGKKYKFTKEELENNFTWDDLNSDDGVGHFIFDGSYIVFPLEKLVFC